MSKPPARKIKFVEKSEFSLKKRGYTILKWIKLLPDACTYIAAYPGSHKVLNGMALTTSFELKDPEKRFNDTFDDIRVQIEKMGSTSRPDQHGT